MGKIPKQIRPSFRHLHFGFLFLPFISLAAGSLFALEGANPTALEPPRIKDPKEIVGIQQQMLDNLIEMTQISLKQQMELRDMLADYRRIQDVYLQNPEDKEMLYRMVKVAYRLQARIKDYHLTHSFDPEFMSELKMLSNIAVKIGVPKP